MSKQETQLHAQFEFKPSLVQHQEPASEENKVEKITGQIENMNLQQTLNEEVKSVPQSQDLFGNIGSQFGKQAQVIEETSYDSPRQKETTTHQKAFKKVSEDYQTPTRQGEEQFGGAKQYREFVVDMDCDSSQAPSAISMSASSVSEMDEGKLYARFIQKNKNLFHKVPADKSAGTEERKQEDGGDGDGKKYQFSSFQFIKPRDLGNNKQVIRSENRKKEGRFVEEEPVFAAGIIEEEGENSQSLNSSNYDATATNTTQTKNDSNKKESDEDIEQVDQKFTLKKTPPSDEVIPNKKPIKLGFQQNPFAMKGAFKIVKRD